MIQRLRQMRNEEGFTLIELLIVIIVLGILAAIVVFAVGGTRDDAVASKCNTEVKSIELSAEGVYAKTGSYPANASGVAVNVNSVNADTYLTDAADNGALLKEWPASDDYVLQWDAATEAVQVFPKSAVANADGTISTSASVAAEPAALSCTTL